MRRCVCKTPLNTPHIYHRLTRTRRFPPNKPVVYECYWSKPQVEARQHPRTVAAAAAVNALWHCSDGQVDFSEPRMYVDRCRIRPPGDGGFALAPHVDNGSLERWEDPAYRHVYRHVLNGDWESYVKSTFYKPRLLTGCNAHADPILSSCSMFVLYVNGVCFLHVSRATCETPPIIVFILYHAQI